MGEAWGEKGVGGDLETRNTGSRFNFVFLINCIYAIRIQVSTGH